MIDYEHLAYSVDFYSAEGFARVEVPWTVTENISAITKPPGSFDFKLLHDDKKVLVASAEQSFLYQYAKGFLPKGRFQAITPCFRKEQQDGTHSKYFMKNELIDTECVCADRLQNMIDSAQRFFNQYVPTRVVKTSEFSYDIMYNDLELGSYGFRSCSFLKWIYGTGCAEPRLSLAINECLSSK